MKTLLGQKNPTPKAIFEESNQLTIKWTGKINSGFKVAPTWVLLPKLIVNFYLNSETDSENDGFGLPFPLW